MVGGRSQGSSFKGLKKLGGFGFSIFFFFFFAFNLSFYFFHFTFNSFPWIFYVREVASTDIVDSRPNVKGEHLVNVLGVGMGGDEIDGSRRICPFVLLGSTAPGNRVGQ